MQKEFEMEMQILIIKKKIFFYNIYCIMML